MKVKFGFKRSLAALLAFAMLSGILPANNVSAANLEYPGKDKSVIYDFWAGIKSGDDIRLLTNYGSDKNVNWAYYSSTPSNALNKGYYGAIRFTSTTTSEDAWVAYKIKSPDAGRYMASFSYKYHIGCDIADMYMLPGDVMDIPAALQSAKPFGSVNFVQENTATLRTVKLGSVDFSSKGEYLFIMKVRKRGSSTSGAGQSGMHITSLLLNGEAQIPLDSVTMQLDNTAISKTNPAHAKVTGKLADGSAAILTPDNLATITYSSSDPSVAAVDQTGLITAMSSGNATITATVTLDGITKTDSKDVMCVLYGGNSTTTELNLMQGIQEEGEAVDALTEYNPAKNSNWKYYINYMQKKGLAKTKGGAVSFIGPDADAWTAIKFKTNKAGLYQLKIAYKNHAGAKSATAYLLSGNVATEDMEKTIKASTPLRIVEFESGMGESIGTFGEIAVTGNTEYILVLKTKEAGADLSIGIGTITATKIILDGNEPGPEIAIISKVDMTLPARLAIGGKTFPKLAGVLTNGLSANLSGASVSYASSAPDVVAVNPTSGEVTGIAGGKATILATVSLGGRTATASSDITVITADSNPEFPGSTDTVKYDFVSCLARNGEVIDPLTDYNLNKNVNWAFAKYFNDKAGQVKSYYGTLWILGTDANTWAAFKLKAPKSGRYNARMTYREHSAALSAYVYLLPGNIGSNGIEAAFQNESPIGTVDFVTGTPTSALQTAELGEVTLSGQTDYILVLKCKEPKPGAGQGQAAMHITEFILNGTAPLESMTAVLEGSATPKSMAIGSTACIKVSTPGNPNEIDNAQMSYVSQNPDIISVDENGQLSAHTAGVANILITAKLPNATKTLELAIVSGSIKSRRSYYTDEKVQNVRENIKRYSWAQQEMKNAVTEADKYVGLEKDLWGMVTTQNLPRSYWVGLRNDPEYRLCPYCGKDIYSKYGSYPWIIDPLRMQWKIRCPECRRAFPSNDFGSFYAAGLDEKGNWNYEKSKENGTDYLKNILYPEKGEGWGVDDGFGYVTGKVFDNKVIENKCFIPYYNEMGLWYATYRYNTSGLLVRAVDSLGLAYVYTGDQRYGKTGAILLDRIADVYPDMDMTPFKQYFNADGGTYRGKVLGKIPDYNLGLNLSKDYDALWSAMDDPNVIHFLSKKAGTLKTDNPKTSPELIRMNCDNGLMREVSKAVRDCRINGNFGQHQMVMAAAAVTLDTLPETKEWIDWIFQSAKPISAPYNKVEGGNVYAQLVDLVDRDGQGNEAAPAYNSGWINAILLVGDTLAGYDKYAAADLYQHPKVQRMLRSLTSFTSCSRYTPSIGDTGEFGKTLLLSSTTNLIKAWNSGIHDPNIARQLYSLSNENVSNLHGDIFMKDPEKMQSDIMSIVKESPSMDLESQNMSGYGLMILRDGIWIDGNKDVDNQHDYWMYYGRNDGHGHDDKLNLGIHAYGIDMAPDLGQPAVKTIEPNRLQWVMQSMSHNTVTVVEKKGNDANYTNVMQNKSVISTPLHFDDSGMVKVMDADAAEAYDSTDIYRRTVVTVDIGNEVSYAVDFFRVKGGDDHIYSFHAQSNDVVIENVQLNAQSTGTYAGPDVPWGADPLTVANEWVTPMKYPAGFTWMSGVNRVVNPSAKTISADFKITDYFRVLPDKMDLHLKLTMLNDTERRDSVLSEFAVVDTQPPKYKDVPETIKQIIARRTGKNLDSLYTTVIQPYKDNPYIQSVEGVNMTVLSGLPGKMDASRAVKVTHTNGRVDYVVYATNNHVTYRVDDLFEFSGFIGVCTVNGDKIIYAYMNDGNKIGEINGTVAYEGNIMDFTKELALNNEIIIKPKGNIDIERLPGNFIYINNDRVQNAAYKIESARTAENGNVMLNIGEITLIRKYKNPDNIYDGYVYNIAAGQSFTIPLTTLMDGTPIFKQISKQRAEVGSELRFLVSATSPSGRELTYTAKFLPRGASFDPSTRSFTWSPDQGLLGKNFAAFSVTDGDLSTTQYVEIDVYGSSSNGMPRSGKPGTEQPDIKQEIKPQPTTTTTDTKSFATKSDAMIVETKLGSIYFPNDSLDGNLNGKLSMESSGNSFDVSVEVSGKIMNPKQPVKVSLAYQPTDKAKKLDCFVVCDASGDIIPEGRLENGNMVFYTSKLGKFTIQYSEKTFHDLDNHLWASAAVTRLAARGIINGTDADTFSPGKNITRADFAVLVVRAFGFKGDVTENFADIEASEYYAREVGIAKALGIVTGQDANKYNPKATISREDMMVIMARALEKSGVKFGSNGVTFTDADDISDYAVQAVDTLAAAGLITGANGKVNPKGKATRAEAAVILDRLIFSRN